MARTFASVSEFLAHGFDTLIDVRSPSEYAEDRVPGAISLPVLSDEERARVGTIYVQEAPFRARKIGAALVARNAAAHIEGPLAAMGGGWRPLVYCWRGGQRSGSFASILSQIGWRADTVAGGYRTWRRLVVAALYEGRVPHDIVLLDGNTGTAKTAILGRLAARGVQVVDLEGLARHRGSLLGHRPGGQPAQKGFESALAQALSALDPARPVVVEAESSKVGEITLPPALWAAMKDAPRIEIAAPIEARAAWLVEAYEDIAAERARLAAILDNLVALRGRAVVARWQDLLREGDLRGLARALMEDHYDPAYMRARKARTGAVLGALSAARLDAAGQEELAAGIEGLLSRRAAPET